MSDQLLYRNFLDHFADAFFLHDDQGLLLDVNTQACDSLGFSRTELLKCKVQDFVLSHDEPQLLALWGSIAPGVNTMVESLHRHQSGAVLPVEIKISCQQVEGRKLFYTMARDISERMRREEEIRQLNTELERRWKDSALLLNSVMRGTSDIVFVKDLQGRYLFSNPAADRIAGLPEGEIIGKTDREIWGGKNNFSDDDAQAMQSSQPVIAESYAMVAGKKVLFQSIKSPYKNEHGEVIGLLGIARDITAQRQAEQELRASYESLQRAERLSRIGSWRLSLDTGEFWASAMMYEMNGADPQGPQLTPDDLGRLMPPHDHARVVEAINLCAQTGQSYSLDVTHSTKERGSFPACILGQADRDASGRIVSISGTVQDLSERVNAKRRLEALADNLPNGAIYSIEGEAEDIQMSYVSAGVEKLIGISAAAIMADRNAYLNAVHPEDRSGYLAHAQAVHLSRGMFDYRFRIIQPNGRIRWLHCRSAPRRMDSEGCRTTWDGIMLDVTREYEAEQALQAAKDAAEAAERTKSEFLATMSHEIRTPMNTVIGMTRLVQQTSLSPKQRNYLEKVELSANALLSIINDILDYSKIEAGMLRLESVDFALDDILETVSAVTTLRAEEKGIEVIYSVSPEVPRQLRGDSLRLSQILNNLVSNAIKFTHHGEVVVSIEKERPAIARNDADADEPQTLLISVRDTGIGMNQAQVQQLFRPFSQADSQTTRRYGGTGLGLAICNRLVQLMSGQFDVLSTPGRGSTFRFTVEMQIAQQPVKRPQIYRVGAVDRVLIVDDNASARDILSTMVTSFGMRTDAVDSGAKALAALHTASQSGNPYSLVLMDWRMPGMDGLETARRIREVEHLASIPAVLMVTAYGRDEVQRQAEQLGLQGLLTKPVTESVLFNSILEILQTQAPSPAHEQGQIQDSASHYPQLKGKRVLVVDDNALNREVAADFLELVGIKVELAADGVQALNALSRQSFDLVLMDVHMPNMDGMQATRAIRAQPALSRLPVIALTAQARTEDRDAIETAGMNAHLSKPIDDKLLYETLCQWMCAGDSAAPRAPTPPQANAQLKSGPAFDLREMQRRFRHNAPLINRVLHGFVRDFSPAPAQLREHLAQSRWQDLGMLAHSLKGSLGYLGAPALMEHAAQLEASCRTPQGIMSLPPQALHHLQQQVPVFAEHLQQLLNQLPTALEAVSESGTPAPAHSLAGIESIIQELRQLIADGNYAALGVFDQLQRLLEQRQHDAQLQRIRKNIEDLEADAALHDLDQLRQQLT